MSKIKLQSVNVKIAGETVEFKFQLNPEGKNLFDLRMGLVDARLYLAKLEAKHTENKNSVYSIETKKDLKIPEWKMGARWRSCDLCLEGANEIVLAKNSVEKIELLIECLTD